MSSRLVDEWGNFTAMPDVVIEAWPSLGTDGVAMFLYLRYRTNHQKGHALEGCAWPDFETIRRDTGMHPRRVARGLQALEDAKFLEPVTPAPVQRRFEWPA